jgi:hypothetical protein
MKTGIFNFGVVRSTKLARKSNNLTTVVPKQKQMQPIKLINPNLVKSPTTYYVCSFGGCGSTILFNYLSNFGNVEHIHDRFPPDKLEYVGKKNTTQDVYSEWFNKIQIPDNEVEHFKVIYIYRNPIDVIFSRFISPSGANVPHLKHIMCENDGNILLEDVVLKKNDLYKLEQFFDNYTSKKKRNYKIYCIKYELFFENIETFNKILEIPDIKHLYPQKHERKKNVYYKNYLNKIYNPLKCKMNSMRFIEII